MHTLSLVRGIRKRMIVATRGWSVTGNRFKSFTLSLRQGRAEAWAAGARARYVLAFVNSYSYQEI